MSKQSELELTDKQVETAVDRLTSFFVRRNLTGYPPTYALAKLFMTTIDAVGNARGDEVLAVVSERLNSVSASDEEFRARLVGRIYEENTDVTRFVLATLAEDAMTKETKVDLWRQEKNHFVWTIEHILPQGENLPSAWQEMLGGPEAAMQVQEEHRHRLGNLTITAYNSNLGNKSFMEKRDRQDSKGRFIGYRNNLSLNTELATRDSWTADDIDSRTTSLADMVIKRFPLP
ncbi:HNH endonuclease family protein [Citricoccus sp. CH26A]|uniref:HNH endonuclease family protein n=1 Tax=Citricoccus TaxID=169133 RepID=UPI001ED8D5A2|nr:HNH endonuclease family protein [Citricoccus sp. CH26A]